MLFLSNKIPGSLIVSVHCKYSKFMLYLINGKASIYFPNESGNITFVIQTIILTLVKDLTF